MGSGRPSILFHLGLSTFPVLPTSNSSSSLCPSTASVLALGSVQLSPSRWDQELPSDLFDVRARVSPCSGEMLRLPGRALHAHQGYTGTECHLEGRDSSLPTGIPGRAAGLPSRMVTVPIFLFLSWSLKLLQGQDLEIIKEKCSITHYTCFPLINLQVSLFSSISLVVCSSE